MSCQWDGHVLGRATDLLVSAGSRIDCSLPDFQIESQLAILPDIQFGLRGTASSAATRSPVARCN